TMDSSWMVRSQTTLGTLRKSPTSQLKTMGPTSGDVEPFRYPSERPSNGFRLCGRYGSGSLRSSHRGKPRELLFRHRPCGLRTIAYIVRLERHLQCPCRFFTYAKMHEIEVDRRELPSVWRSWAA